MDSDENENENKSMINLSSSAVGINIVQRWNYISPLWLVAGSMPKVLPSSAGIDEVDALSGQTYSVVVQRGILEARGEHSCPMLRVR